MSTRPIFTFQKSGPMGSWKRCTPPTFNSGYSYNHGEYLLENVFTHFDVSLLPSLERLSSTFVTDEFTYFSDDIV